MYLRGRTVILLLVFTVLFSSLGTAVVVGEEGLLSHVVNSSISKKDTGLESEKLSKAYGMIKSRYIQDVDDTKLLDGAIRGMVGSLDDPYSTYMDEKMANQFHSSMESSFQGIGAEVTMKEGRVTIVSPFKGSPAEKAGLRPEDQIIKVNNTSLEGMDLNEAVSKIKGPKGSKAKLDVLRPGQDKLLSVTVIRDEIPIETVRATMLEGEVGRIDITQFSQDTAEDFAKELAKLEKEGMKGLVIDVRGNPGGLLPSVIDISEELLAKGKKIMMVEEKSGSRVKYNAESGEEKLYPMVLLTDKGSASASEILAGAMKAAGYPTIGQTTFGKGTVQTAEDFSDGSNLKLTMAKWLTPDGSWIHKKGIKPTVEAKLPSYYMTTPPYPEKPLKRDQTSQEIENLQQVLEGLGYRPGRTDGYYSEQTETATKAFQKANQLPVTGVVNQKTAAKLQEKFIAMLKEPESDIQLRVGIETLKKKMQ